MSARATDKSSVYEAHTKSTVCERSGDVIAGRGAQLAQLMGSRGPTVPPANASADSCNQVRGPDRTKGVVVGDSPACTPSAPSGCPHLCAPRQRWPGSGLDCLQEPKNRCRVRRGAGRLLPPRRKVVCVGSQNVLLSATQSFDCAMWPRARASQPAKQLNRGMWSARLWSCSEWAEKSAVDKVLVDSKNAKSAALTTSAPQNCWPVEPKAFSVSSATPEWRLSTTSEPDTHRSRSAARNQKRFVQGKSV